MALEPVSTVLMKRFSPRKWMSLLSGLLAFGLAYMNGVAGLAGWRWMFLLEGAPVLLGGVATIFVLPDYPNDKAKFLSQEDRELIISELPENQPTADSKTW
ncbi:hypothetical protein LTR15_007428 [Elasticomyces elasticus]|nr:hypothetical protein LTR15_007428 [Elasticomyces elasticus]